MDDWYLQRHGHPDCRYHLNLLLGSREKLTIGRKAGGAVDIVCNGKTVSREHCVLKFIDNYWTIEDLKSLNGVYLNSNRIPAYTPTTMYEGCILGVGAIDTSELDYYVFDVLKNTVKRESEDDDAVKIVELPIPAANSDDIPCDPLEVSSSRAGSLLEGNSNLPESLVDKQNNNFEVPSVPGLVKPAQRDSSNLSLEDEPPRKQSVIPEKPVKSEEVLPAKNLPVGAEKNSTRLDSPPLGSISNSSFCFLVRNQYGDFEISSALPNSRRPSLDDVKLKLGCRVVIEGMPKGFTVSGTNGTWKTHTKKRAIGKRRVLRCISDSDSESEKIPENSNHHSKNPSVKAELNGKELKVVVNIEKPTSSLDDYSDEDEVVPSPIPSTSKASSNQPVTKPKFFVEKLSNATEVEQKVISDDDGTERRISPAPLMRVEDSEELVGDCEILKVDTPHLHRSHHYPDSDDDVIILSSGDEETFSSQSRFKQEQVDAPDSSSATHDAAKPLSTNENITPSSSDDENSPFFPELSQAFLNEIAQEESDEEQTNLSKKISERGADVDKLNTLKHQQRIMDTNESPESCKLRTLTEERVVLRKNKTCLIASIDAANKNGQSDEARMHARKLEQLEVQIEGVDRSLRECKKNHYTYFNSERMRCSFKKDVISGSQVIFSTLNSCRSRDMENLFVQNRSGTAFLCCIIDEASQCTEPESLTPLVFGVSKLVLIGDPDQLPATVTSQYAARNRFDQSLFNRFYSSRSSNISEDEEGVLMLDTQYRMAPSICEWPSKYFYGGKLVTAENLPRSGPCYEYRVLNVIDGQEILEDQSYKNEREALLVAKVVQLILNSSSAKGKSVGVITFYRSQQQCILKKIGEEAKHLQCAREIERVEVNTVDSFQGREKDIVIVSCVRAREARNLAGDIGFVSSLQRLNVALTRAKESLVVCGHFQTLQMNETWRDLINNAQGREVAHVVTSDYTAANLSPLVMRPEHKV
ncbi:hypothetical protein GHT06_017809 [Daphnia sinensis]|uniref:FHA domain-containing protein n=1 Tax=Daphnia sinensis TaxID=1820382 RepID=A0AAD5KMB2_9CRUS|nr:hypothetical protein GHT06_017809 [Daphnia sinensis]